MQAQRIAVAAVVGFRGLVQPDARHLAAFDVRESLGRPLARIAAVRHEFLEQEAATRDVEHPEPGLRGRQRVVDDGKVAEAVEQPLPPGALGRARRQRQHLGIGGRCGRHELVRQPRLGTQRCDGEHSCQQHRGGPDPWGSSHARAVSWCRNGRPRATRTVRPGGVYRVPGAAAGTRHAPPGRVRLARAGTCKRLIPLSF